MKQQAEEEAKHPSSQYDQAIAKQNFHNDTLLSQVSLLVYSMYWLAAKTDKVIFGVEVFLNKNSEIDKFSFRLPLLRTN